ncbi:hypothetical protein C8R46DRAFT_1077037 [Mycena filopes]|nr:hypothetical protein C8R46DRAFT_1077037 [Mycena filopes]
MSPEFGALSTEDRLLLGSVVPSEEIVVEEMKGDARPFSVRFHIPMFQKRMMLGRQIILEFIAQGRLWELKFFTAIKPTAKHLAHGGWSGLLRITDNSPMTPVLFGLAFLDARASPTSSAPFLHHYGKKDSVLYVSGDVAPKEHGIISWSWKMFEQDSVCIASDGSVTGILGIKLVAADAPKEPLKTIPTSPDEPCVIA